MGFDLSYLSFSVVNIVHLILFFYYILSLEFPVSKMGLTTLLAQPISIFRAKLWKVVTNCKNSVFFNFQALFVKMFIFEVATFFLACLYNQLNFSVALRMYKIYVFDVKRFSF